MQRSTSRNNTSKESGPRESSKRDTISRDEIEYLVIENDSGARIPESKNQTLILFSIAIIWSLFQLWVASPLPFITNFAIFNDSEIRSIHLAFALFLVFLAFPAFKWSSRKNIGIFDWILAFAGAFCALYIYLNYTELSARSGAPTAMDVIIGITGIAFIFEATRRSLGLPLIIIAGTLLLYTYYGSSEYIPDILRHKGHSLNKIASHMWLTTEGVFGIALGVSANFVFLFVLFGSLLDKAGAGNYFTTLAFSIVGHLRGGPAKAAVISSALTGVVSGSSIANVVTTGTFTIPLMKKVGFSGEDAGAIEVSSSVNGQIMPPVMGAAAFLMVNYVGISYLEVIKHALIPALISYIALIYMVHIEAVKSNMRVLKKQRQSAFYLRFLITATTIVNIILLSCFIYYAISWLKPVFGEYATLNFTILIAFIYILLIKISSKNSSENVTIDTSKPLPQTFTTFKSGLHFILPIAVLIWFLMIERKSPGLSAFFATICMIFITITQPILYDFFSNNKVTKNSFITAIINLIDGLVTGARNMVAIAIATAMAGIVVGVISLTGTGLILTEVIELIAGDSIILILLMTALICLILGMGLPTTANYIVVAALMANVVRTLAEKNGIYIPLIAIHLFVFYFGIMADITPPVGLASFAAAAISGSDPIKTGLSAFKYSLRTIILPFFFIFNTEIILYEVTSIWYGIWVFTYSTIAILIFSTAMQNFFLVKNKLHETIILLAVSTIIFMPSLLNDTINPKYTDFNILNNLDETITFPENSSIIISGTGEDLYGDPTKFKKYLNTNNHNSIQQILQDYGITKTKIAYRKLIIEDVTFNSQADKHNISSFSNFIIEEIRTPLVQPDKKFMYIIALLLFIFVLTKQLIRKRKLNALNTADSWNI